MSFDVYKNSFKKQRKKKKEKIIFCKLDFRVAFFTSILFYN